MSRKSYDALVVGAGIAGLSAALGLAKLGQKVLVLEKDRTGGNASRAAAGLVDPWTEAGEDSPVLEIGREAYRFYPSFVREVEQASGIDTEFEKRGILYAAFNAADEKFLGRRGRWQKKNGIAVEFLSAEEARRLEPVLSPKARGGFYYPGIPKINANKLTSALFKTARRAGVKIQMSVKNLSAWTEKGAVRGVKLGAARIESPVLVYAAGCWTGFDPGLPLPAKVKPVRGQILLLRAEKGSYPRHILHSTRYAYIIPWPGRRILAGSTLEPGTFDCRVTPSGARGILARAGELIPGIGKLKVEKSWAGLRPFAEGERPLVGPSPEIRGLYFATGYYRAGILLGPLAGKRLAEGIVRGKFSDLLTPFFPGKRNG